MSTLVRQSLAALVAALALGTLAARPVAAHQQPATRSAPTQEPSAEALEEARRLLELSRTGSPVVRPQAAARFAGLGEAAGLALEEAAGEDLADLAGLGPELLGEIGGLARGALRDRMHGAVLDADFPWRPAVLRGLAAAVQETDAAAFSAALDDRLAASRAAALDGLAALDRRQVSAAVRARLHDSDGAVRARAALLLDLWGEPEALAYALEELRRADRFFEAETGARARRDTAAALGDRLGDLFGYDPRALPTEGPNPAALAALEAALRERAGDAWPAELPAHVRASDTAAEGPVGLELRSCRAGELRLVLTDDDALLVGEGSPARVALPEGTVRALIARFADLPERLGDDVFGRPGCDLERFRVRVPGELAPASFHVLKEAAPAPDLRPDALDELASALLELCPEGPAEDPRLDDLRGRLERILEAIGGELSSA